jgi:3(or 17)beta-hydroxysteroid dehydrogenase
MRMELDNKIVLVTGGAGGIGSAVVRMMAEAGAHVIATDRFATAPDGLTSTSIEYQQLDVADEAAWHRVVQGIEQRFGRVDVLVNAAGTEGDQQHNTVISTTLADWRRVHSINLDGTFLGCRAVIPLMEKATRGSIVNVSSVASYFPMPFHCAYGSSKAAVQQFTKSVAAWGTRNGNRIRCNSVHPGLVRTDMLRKMAAQRAARDGLTVDESISAHAKSAIPLGTAAEPEDIANQILYFASDLSGQVTGTDVCVDGGWALAVGGWQRRLESLVGSIDQ